MGSIQGVLIAGVILAVLDLLFGIYVLGFYGKIQHNHFHCPWAHGIRSCDFFLFETNHNTRTIIGLAEGIVSIVFSTVLLVAFLRRLPYLAWIWLLKAVIVILMNAYFVADWLIKRGRYYHSYWDPDEYNEETVFIAGGFIEIGVQLILSFIFCCLAASFTYKIRRQERAMKAAETQI
ncbi:hypothetical protein FHG87_008147 [Trinorchestia longiramus]|nr:hypothetical protein FHG87_008147 [Trinorchestia longiramus]